MINKRNEIYSRVKESVKSLCTNTTQTYSATQSTFPCLFFKQSNNRVSDTNLEGDECAVTPIIQIEVFTNGSGALLDAEKIVGLADDEMRSMYFRRIFGPEPMDNLADRNIARMVCRYSRMIGSGDSL